MKLLTTSRAKDYRACPRLHHIQYDLQYRPVVDADVLRFGSLMHRGLEAWWLAMKAGADALTPAIQTIRANEADPFDLVRAEVMMAAYHTRWEREELEILAVEVRFETDLRNPESGAASRTWRLAGKIDAVVRDLRTRQVLIVEHKTASGEIGPGSDYIKRLRLDGQISVYLAGAKSLGYDVQACLYDVLGKPAQRPSQVPLTDEAGEKIVLDAAGARVRTKDGKKWRQTGDSASGYVLQTRDETPEEFRGRLVEAITTEPDTYFQRAHVVRLDAELQEANFELWQLGVQIREAEKAQRWPRNPDACVRYGRTCAFFDHCTGAASLDDQTKYRRLEEAHPELIEEAQHAGA